MNNSHHYPVVVLTGAGVSAESGLRTFRDNNGLWEDHRIEDVATPEAFARNPDLVHRFYNMRRQQLADSNLAPNQAHESLAEFEARWPGKFSLITQNVDNLHERSGSDSVVHMHGELSKIRCNATGIIYDHASDVGLDDLCDCCGISGNLRPHIVWFGEIPLYMDLIETRLSECELFVSIGTSGTVYPAAGFRDIAAAYGAKTVELNLEPSASASLFDESIYGLASKIVPQFFESL